MMTEAHCISALSSPRTRRPFPERERALFYPRLIWLLPAAFTLHVMEEAPGFASWVEGTIHGHMNPVAFYVNNAVFMAILVGLCGFAARRRTPLATGALFVMAAGQFFWNAVFHLYTTIAFHAYSPGVVTATFLYVPLFLYLAYVAVRERFVSPGAIAVSMPVGALGLLLLIWGGLYQFETVPCTWWMCR